MFEPRKKIRQLNEDLNSEQQSQPIAELNEAILANKPKHAQKAFQENLKNKLLKAHNTMSKEKNEKKENSSSSVKKSHPSTNLWADFRMKGLAMAMCALVLVVIGGVVAYPLIPAPVVQGYILKNNVRAISVNAPIKVTFSQPMNNDSVEKAFSVDPALPGKFSWKGNTLNYTPNVAFKIGDTYKVSISRDAKSILQKPMESVYSEEYKIVKAPEVILMTPNDKSVGQTKERKINIMFDRQVTGFTTLEGGEANFPAISITPAVEGRWKWLGTSALQFEPKDGLKMSTEYTVRVPAGTVTLDGGSTEKEFVSVFETVRPEAQGMISTDGGTSTDISTNSHFKINFNQKVDLASAREMIKMIKVDGAKKMGNVNLSVNYFSAADWRAEQKQQADRVDMNQVDEIAEAPADTTTSSEPSKVPDQDELEKSIIITPDQKLDADGNYSIEVRQGLKGFDGGLTSTADVNFDFKVYGEIKLISQNAFDTNMSELAYPVFVFNNEVDLRSLKGKVSITPAEKDSEGKAIPASVSNNYLGINVGYEYLPATDYKISIAAGIKDIFGNVFNQPLELSFTTPNYGPALSLESGSDMSVVDGTKPTLFYVKSVNIDAANIALKKLTEDQFRGFYGNGWVDYQRISYTPDQFEMKANLPIKLVPNERGHSALDLDKLFGGKTIPGFYYMEISNPNVYYEDCSRISGCQKVPKKEKLIFTVSKSSLAIKISTNEIMVWATSMQEGKPVSGMKIRAIDATGLSVASGETNFEGIAKLDISKVSNKDGYYSDYTIIGEQEGDLAMAHTSWSEGVAPWNFNISSETYTPQYYAYAYTDRPIYRPDQEVFFKGIVRKEVNYKFKLPDVSKANVKVTDSNGNEIYNKDETLNKNGTFDGTLKLGANIATGDYSVDVTLLGTKGPEWASKFYTGFKVYEYRKPEYKLDITPDKKDYVNGEKAKIKIESGYFFGAPLPDAEVKWTVKSSDYYFILPEELASKLAGSWFSFAEEGMFCYWGCQGGSEIVSQGTVKTDANGVALVDLPLQIGDKKMSQIYTLEATVSDANNQSVANRVSFPVHSGAMYLGLRGLDYIVSTDQPAKFEVLSVTTDGQIKAGQSVEAALYKREWNTVKRKNVDGGYYYENNYDDKQVEKKSVRTGDNGLGEFEFKLKDGGSYKVEVSAADGRGNNVKSSTTVYVSSGDYINWGSQNNDKIELVTDKMEYKVGDTAKVLIKSPYKGVNALVTFEKDKVMEAKVIKLDSNSQTFEVPITEKYLPNVFVSVVIMKGSNYDAGLAKPTEGAIDERQVASFKVGYATLPVNTESKKLNLEISSDKKRYNPGEEVKLTVKSTDFTGKPVAAEVSVGVVDESVLSLTSSVTADLLNVFYRKRLLGVGFAETLTKAISRVNVQVEAGMKGGGGGGIAKRGDFKDTAYFKAEVNTDASGLATITFKLPDNLTTWQAMAIGISDDTRGEKTLVGSGKYSFLSNKDIMVRPVLPRFMVTGDKMKVSAIVQNYTEKDQDMKVSLDVEGVIIKDAVDKNVAIKAGKSQKIDWMIEVGAPSDRGAKLDFIAVSNTDGLGDDVVQKLPIKESTFPSFVATNKVISDGMKNIDQVWLPVGVDTSKGKLEITMAPTLAGTINQGLEYLMAYPYGCTEQLASSILPNLALKKLIDTGKFETKSIDAVQLKKNVQSGLEQLYKNQKSSGGFGLWFESESSAYLTAYVVETMNEAMGAGYAVDKNVMERSVNYLKEFIKNNALSGDRMAYNSNNRAYILYVLSEIGQGDLGLNNNLYELRKNLSLISKAYLAMANKNVVGVKADSATKAKIEILVKELENAAVQTPRGVSFQEANLDYSLFDSNTRTTAVVMKALNRIEPENPLIPKILQALLKERQAGHFSTTQETAVGMLALIEYLESSKELSPAYSGVVTVAGKEVLNKNITSKNLFETSKVEISLKDLLGNNFDNEVAAQKTGNGKMYVDMNLEYYLPLALQRAENQGIEISQEYFAQEDVLLTKPLTAVKVGQNLHAKMTVIVPEDRHYVMVEDFLPAGLEGVDFNLNTSEQNLQDGEDECRDYCDYNEWYFNHSEVRDDRVMYFADFLPKGVYEIDYYVRSTSVGEFADLPAMAQETYFPEVFGRTAGQKFEVIE